MAERTAFWVWTVLILAGVVFLAYCALYAPADVVDAAVTIGSVGVFGVLRRRFQK